MLFDAVGVDGCKAGWFHFTTGDDGFDFGVSPDLDALAAIMPKRGRRPTVLIDIPIGLLESPSDLPAVPSAAVPGSRPGSVRDRGCDAAARQVLGARSSSVFPAPMRQVLDCPDYAKANATERALSGLGLSRQTYGIVPKIREADVFVQGAKTRRCRLREAHPEVCFWAANGQRSLLHPKKSDAGFRERMSILETLWPEAEVAVAKAYLWTKRAEVARDDIVDALILALTARLPSQRLKTFPARPRKDPRGIPMEMVYGDWSTASGNGR